MHACRVHEWILRFACLCSRFTLLARKLFSIIKIAAGVKVALIVIGALMLTCSAELFRRHRHEIDLLAPLLARKHGQGHGHGHDGGGADAETGKLLKAPVDVRDSDADNTELDVPAGLSLSLDS